MTNKFRIPNHEGHPQPGSAAPLFVIRVSSFNRHWLFVIRHWLLCLWLVLICASPASGTNPPLPHQVYVWQRAWTAPVQSAVANRATNFSAVVFLAAEVTWNQGKPQVVRVALDHEVLARCGRPVGLALRIGSFSGPFQATGEPAQTLCHLASDLVAEARRHQLLVAELQVDFDCAESKLEGYRVWLETLRETIAPVRLTFTALPSWLKHAEFGKLAETTGGYVLQVHSFERPKNAAAPFVLCDPAAARAAVERAAQWGIPLWVALPTYGYVVAFDSAGRFIGLSAEGPAKTWPAGSQTREVRADPVVLAGLVETWSRERPVVMHGIIWYRLPVAGEILNWRWPTLSKVMAGQVPQPSLRAEIRRPMPALAEIEMANAGDADFSGPVVVAVRHPDRRLVASDGWDGFQVVETSPVAVQFRRADWRLAPGERRKIGWLRLDQEAEVTVELVTER